MRATRWAMLRVAEQFVTFYHGTNWDAAQHIWAEGFRPLDFRELANSIEDRYRLPRDSVWDSTSYEFERGFRDGDARAYLTTSFDVASSYAEDGGESVSDALSAAWRILHEDPDTFDGLQQWRLEQLGRYYSPAVVVCEVPFSVLEAEWAERGVAHPFSYEEFLGEFSSDHYTLMPEHADPDWIVEIRQL